jgi:hypothetical protein
MINQNKVLALVKGFLALCAVVLFLIGKSKSRHLHHDENWVFYIAIGVGFFAVLMLLNYFDKPKQ